MPASSRSHVAAIAVCAALLAHCAGLPKALVDEAARTGQLVEDEARRTDTQQEQFASFRESDAYAAVRIYAEREAWGSFFEAARSKIQSAESIFKIEVLPALENDAPEDADAVRAALAKVSQLLVGARASARQWSDRRDFLLDVADRAEELMSECEASLGAMREAYPQLTAAANRAKRGHAARTEDIDRLVADLAGVREPSDEAMAAAAAEFRKRQAGTEFDLAVFGDSCSDIGENSATLLKGVPEVEARLAELDRSYSRTLIDMKVEHDLVVRRESWNERVDYPTPHMLDFRVTNVDAAAFEHLVGIQGSLAKLSGSLFGTRFSMLSGTDEASWNALGIDPIRQWPQSDTDAEYWVQDAESRYYHRYLVQEDGETRETDWTQVTEDFFFANIDNLGMDVESKPYGSFNSEKLTHAAPPGMAYVGNPHYGRWGSDGGGGLIWIWAGRYLFYSTLFGSPMRYGRSDWNTWSGGYRGSRPYYGGSAEAPKWGTKSQSVRTSPRMQGSTFARSGGFRRPPTSVRGAGPSARSTSFGASGK